MSTMWESVSFSLNGQDFPMGEVSVGRRPLADEDVLARSSFGTYEVNVSAVVPSAAFDFTALMPRRPGASDESLVRRVRYGGRKGRSALRRLFRQSAPVQMAYGPVLVWGRCVMLEPGEMVFRMNAPRRRR